jgi:hypothetical protein
VASYWDNILFLVPWYPFKSELIHKHIVKHIGVRQMYREM